jgi:tetratricopeptide (TPR) repeat protein
MTYCVWLVRLPVAVLVATVLVAVPAWADIVIPGLLARPATPAAKLFQAGIDALAANDLAKAEASFKESLKLDNGAAAPYMGLAQVALRRGQNAAAEGLMKQALALAPNTASIQTTWGTYLYSQRELPEAEEALRRATQLDPKGVIAHVQLGDLYLAGFQKPAEAIKEYRTAISIAPDHAGAHYALGLALASQNTLAEAETELLRASKIAPKNPLPLHTLGRIYAEQQKFDQAHAMFAEAAKVAPRFAAPHVERGNLFAAKGQDDLALKEYTQAQEIDPKRSIGYTNIGMVHQRHQRWAEAEKAYLSAIKIEPNNSVAYNNLAWMAAERKANLAQALTWAQKAVSLAPGMPEYQGTLAWVYRAQGEMDKAEQTLRIAAAITPQRAAVVYTLGRVYLERGKTAAGIAEFKKALALDPGFPGADDARKKLKELEKS